MEKTWQNCDFTNNWMSLYKGWEEEMKTGERGHVSNERAEAAPNLTTISSVLHLWAPQEPFLLQPSKPGWMMKKTKTKKRHLMWSDETRGWNLLVSLVPAGKNTQARHPENTAPPRSMAEAASGSALQWPGVYVWIKQSLRSPEAWSLFWKEWTWIRHLWGGDLRWALHRRRSCNLADLERFSKEP